MPKTEFLLQGATASDHFAAARDVLSLSNAQSALISVAFATEGGMRLLEGELKKLGSKATLLCGIRNGTTTAQALSFAIGLGVKTYAVDTGSRTPIFHPKVFFAQSTTDAKALIGSANLTPSGLLRNVEAGVAMAFALSDKTDAALAADIVAKLTNMIGDYPQNVLPIGASADVQKLLESGRVLDETLVTSPTATAGSKDPSLDSVPKMKLKIGSAPTVVPQPKPVSPTRC